MAETTFMTFLCLNPECRQKIKLARPAKSGVYAITCPHCGLKKQFKLKGLDESVEAPKKTDNSQKQPIEVKEDFLVGIKYELTCPHCNAGRIGFETEKPGHRTLSCPNCKGKIGMNVRNKTVAISETIQPFIGKLTLLRKGWINKDYILKEGKNIVGRYDESAPSDISIKKDPSMSRRSVVIDVTSSEKGYFFKLKVLNATNPVLHNNTPLYIGDTVSLNFGDSITLGQTRFRFDKMAK